MRLGINDLVDQLVGQISGQTYSTGSSALHAGTLQAKVGKLTGWVFAIFTIISEAERAALDRR